jgi:hypothetical protein
MQYELTLPADYDMGIIRHRVKTRGHRTDDFEGLAYKAYLIRERGKDDSPVNQYAPFYIWASASGMNRFLWGGGGFAGIVTDFGRPPVKHWTGAAYAAGPAIDKIPTAANRWTQKLDAGTDPTDEISKAIEEASTIAEDSDVHSVSVAVDPYNWEIVRMTIGTKMSPGGYQILHFSSPELKTLTPGRQW